MIFFSTHSIKICLILKALRDKNDFHLQQSSLVCVTSEGVRNRVCHSLEKGHIRAGMAAVPTPPWASRGNHNHATNSFEWLCQFHSRDAKKVQLPGLAQRQDQEYSCPAWGQDYLSAADTAKWNASWHQNLHPCKKTAKLCPISLEKNPATFTLIPKDLHLWGGNRNLPLLIQCINWSQTGFFPFLRADMQCLSHHCGEHTSSLRQSLH